MGILYVCVLILLIVAFILLKKSDKKQNAIFWIVTTLILVIPYNVLATYLITAIGLKCTLLNLTIVNLIVTSIISILIYKEKKIQKYYIRKQDIIAILIIFLVVGFILYKQYTTEINLKFETTDPAVHFEAAKNFFEQKVLLYKGEQTSFYGYEIFMPLAYVNTGIIFDIFSNVMSIVSMYKLYILFDCMVFILICMMFYLTISIKCKKRTILAIVLTLIFITGYALNSLLFGFSYLSTGLLMSIGIIAFVLLYKNKHIMLWIKVVGLFLLMFGLFFSYYLFVPIMYSAVGIYILMDIIKNKKNTKIFSKENIIKVLGILILPTMLGFIYFILPGFTSGRSDLSAVTHEGYVYRCLYINSIPFIPFVLYYIIQGVKKNKNDIIIWLILMSLLYVVVTFMLTYLGKMSTYYFYKIYYLLWIITVAGTFFAICKMTKNEATKLFIYSYIVVYISLIGIIFLKLDEKLKKRNVLLDPEGKAEQVLDIQVTNANFIKDKTVILNPAQIEAVKYLNENFDKNKMDSILIHGDMLERLWVYVLTDIKDAKELNDMYESPIEKIEEFYATDKKYIFVLSDNVNEIEQAKNDNRATVIYSNENAVLLEKNN